MKASDLMTKEVVSVSPDMAVREIACVLLSHHVSAAPVVDGSGNVIGMVSEGDLIGPNEGAHAARRERWLEMLAKARRSARISSPVSGRGVPGATSCRRR